MMRKPYFWIALGMMLGLAIWAGRRPHGVAGRDGEDGLEFVTVPATATAQQADVVAARIDPARWTLRAVDRRQPGTPHSGADAEEACPTPGAAINASFFDEHGDPLGLLIINGKQIRPRHPVSGWPGGGGLFVVRKGVPSILPLTAQPPADAETVLQCWPRLVIDGKIPSFKQRPAAIRSAVGIDGKGRVLFVASTTSLTFEAWAALLRDQLGCVQALNLDGGPSTQLAIRGPRPLSLPGGWDVPVLLTAEKKGKAGK